MDATYEYGELSSPFDVSNGDVLPPFRPKEDEATSRARSNAVFLLRSRARVKRVTGGCFGEILYPPNTEKWGKSVKEEFLTSECFSIDFAQLQRLRVVHEREYLNSRGTMAG